MTRDVDICQRTSDNAANFPVCAGISLSHLNSNHANIAVVPNGFYCTVTAECTNSYGVNESFFFFLYAAERLSSVLQVPAEWFELIFFFFYREMVFMEAYCSNEWLKWAAVSKLLGHSMCWPKILRYTETYYTCWPHCKYVTVRDKSQMHLKTM